MKKDALMSKKVKAIIASAMAAVLAIPSMALFNKVDVKADVELPSPIAVYDFEDLTAEGVELVDNEVKPDVKDDTDRSGKVLELKDSIVTSGTSVSYTNSEAKIENPYKGHTELLEEPEFAGYERSNFPIWETGVTISYWQKSSSTDSATISFSNVRENVIHKDDVDKMELFNLYESKPDDPLFALGEVDTLEYTSTLKLPNGDGRNVKVNSTLPAGTYTVYKDCGIFIRFNPNYKSKDESGADCCYLKANWEYDRKLGRDSIASYTLDKIGDAFNKDDYANFDAEGSEIRYAPKTAGGLQINSSGSWSFYESGAVAMKKGTANYETASPQRANYAVASSFITDGGKVKYQPEALVNKPGEWHYITRVIKNDCIITYVDGEEKDRKIYTDTETAEQVMVNKSFNVGWGYYGSASEGDPIITMTGVDDIFKTGTGIGYGGSTDPIEGRPGFNGNTNGITIMEMLVNEGTTLSFGGHGLGTDEAATYYVGTAEGTALDNVAFYDVPFTAEQAAALYELAKTKNIEPAPSVSPEPSESADPEPSDSAAPEPSGSTTPKPSESVSPSPSDSAAPKPSESTGSAVEVMLGDVDGNKEIELKDAQLALKAALDLMALKPEQIKVADVDKDNNVTLKDAQLILKFALDLIDKFD